MEGGGVQRASTRARARRGVVEGVLSAVRRSMRASTTGVETSSASARVRIARR
jgi:hypothetical protein